jgi:hypothetical protein
MKKPIRKATSMGDGAIKRKAMEAAQAELLRYKKNPKLAGARPKGTRPAAPWAIQSGASKAVAKLDAKIVDIMVKDSKDMRAGYKMAATQKAKTVKKKPSIK